MHRIFFLILLIIFACEYPTEDIIINDVVVKDNILIYNLYLQSLSKYKLNDLQMEAQKVGIKITNEKGKAKLKNDLYREINIKKL